MSAPESALLSAPMRKRSHKERGLYEDLRALSFQKFSPPKALGALRGHRPIESKFYVDSYYRIVYCK